MHFSSPLRCCLVWSMSKRPAAHRLPAGSCLLSPAGRSCISAFSRHPRSASLELLLKQLAREITGTHSSLTLPYSSRQKIQMSFGLAGSPFAMPMP